MKAFYTVIQHFISGDIMPAFKIGSVHMGLLPVGMFWKLGRWKSCDAGYISSQNECLLIMREH
jgi:hypothetical protein